MSGRLLFALSLVLASTTAHATEKVKLPDARYVAFMNDGKCATFQIEDGKPTSFAVAASCKADDIAKPEITVEKVKVKGNTYTFGAATYVVESHENGMIKGEWRFQGAKYPVAFLKQP